VSVVPYRLPELIEAIANGYKVLIVEGEAKVDLLWSWNVPATCCAGGAKKWHPEHSAFLRGAHVVILPDNDPIGHKHVEVVAASLEGIAASIRVLELPVLPPKGGDIIDWARNGGTVDELHDLIKREAKPWGPGEAAKASGHDGGAEPEVDAKNNPIPNLANAERKGREKKWSYRERGRITDFTDCTDRGQRRTGHVALRKTITAMQP
jgi:hypothetical protein